MKVVYLFILIVTIGTSAFAQTNTSGLLKYPLKLTTGDENRRSLATGTGFLLHYKNEYFLVTNFHVLTAKDPDTGLKLSGYRDTSHFIAVSFRENHTDTTLRKRILPLYDSAGTKKYSVYHYVQGTLLDIAVLRFDRSDFLDLRDTIYAVRNFYMDADNVNNLKGYLVGFPRGKVINGWKPRIDDVITIRHNDIPKDAVNPFIFLKHGSEPGMSGSPIFFQDFKTKKYMLGGVICSTWENTTNLLIKAVAVNIREVLRFRFNAQRK